MSETEDPKVKSFKNVGHSGSREGVEGAQARMKALALAVLLVAVGCATSSPAPQCADGLAPTKVTPMATYILEQCQSGQLITLNVPGRYDSGQSALADALFLSWAFGPHYSSYPFYRSYVSSPIYRTYNITHVHNHYNSPRVSTYRSYSSSRGRR